MSLYLTPRIIGSTGLFPPDKEAEKARIKALKEEEKKGENRLNLEKIF